MGRRGITLVEILALVAVACAVVAIAAPVLGQPARAARRATSQDNLRFWGVASGMYMGDFAARLPSYTWEAGQTYEVAGTGKISMAQDSVFAATWQETDLLRRLTGRTAGHFKIRWLRDVYPHRRRSHLVLVDYLGLDETDRHGIDPRDRNQLVWHHDPLAFEANGVYPEPTVSGSTLEPSLPVVQRWPFTSSYHVVPAAWSPDERVGSIGTVGPVDASNLFTGTNAVLGQRTAFEIALPAQKVFMFEWHDRHSASQDLWYAYPQARPNKLMFDGSVQDRPTGEAGEGFDPNEPGEPEAYRYPYTPLTTDPPAVGDPNAVYPVSFRFTRDGLAGFDYTP